MQIKTTLKFCLTVVSMVNKKTSIKCCWVHVYSSAVGNVWKSLWLLQNLNENDQTIQLYHPWTDTLAAYNTYKWILLFILAISTPHKLVNQPRYPLMGEGRKTMWYKQNTVFIQEGRWICAACRKMDRAGEHHDKWTVGPYGQIQIFSGIHNWDGKWHEQRRENVVYLGMRTGRWDMGVKHDQHVWKCHNETILYNACSKNQKTITKKNP